MEVQRLSVLCGWKIAEQIKRFCLFPVGESPLDKLEIHCFAGFAGMIPRQKPDRGAGGGEAVDK